MQPKVSIIICGYNQAPFVSDAVESVLSQTYAEVEAVVVDNGSKDNSREVLQKYVGNPKVQLLLHETNDAVTKRLNDAIAKARGEFIGVLYADDYYLPEFVENCVTQFQDLETGVVYCRGYRFNVLTGRQWLQPSYTQSGGVFPSLMRDYFRTGYICPVATLIRKECYLQYPYREEVFQEAEAIFMRFSLSYRFQFVDKALCVMREHDSNMGKALEKNQKIFFYLLEKLRQEKTFPAAQLETWRDFVAETWRVFGWFWTRFGGDALKARECYLNAVHYRWHEALHPKWLLGMILSYLPRTLQQKANQLGFFLHPPKENVVVKQTY